MRVYVLPHFGFIIAVAITALAISLPTTHKLIVSPTQLPDPAFQGSARNRLPTASEYHRHN
jgi:hypothetical protein